MSYLMRTPTALLLAFGMACSGFVAARLIFRSHPEGVVASQPVADSHRIQTFEPPPALEMPDNRVPVPIERPPEPAPAAQPVEQAKPATALDPSDPRTLPESTLAEMEEKRNAIQMFLEERTFQILTQRLDDGLSEKVADGDSWSPSKTDMEVSRTMIEAVRRLPGQPWYRAVLPREEYPEHYVYKDEVIRLGALMQEQRRTAR